MKTLLALGSLLVILNVALFVVLKFLNFVEPLFFKLFFNKDAIDGITKDPEFQARSRVRTKYAHWFWSVWLVFYYAVNSLNGLNLYLAMATGLALYFVGKSEAESLSAVSFGFRVKSMAEGQAQIDSFLQELQKRIEAAQADKKDEERN